MAFSSSLFAALPIVFKAIQEPAFRIIRRFTPTDEGKLAEHSHHPIQVGYLLFNLIDLLVTSLGNKGSCFPRTKGKTQEILSVFERKAKTLNFLDKLDDPHIRFRVLSKT